MKFKTFLIKLINFYQKFISPLFGQRCKFYSTCSQYTKEAINKYGGVRGLGLGIQRILRCHPWQKNQIDKLK